MCVWENERVSVWTSGRATRQQTQYKNSRINYLIIALSEIIPFRIVGCAFGSESTTLLLVDYLMGHECI